MAQGGAEEMSTVLNMRGRNGIIPPGAVYIGRAARGLAGSKWANRFKIGEHGSRDEVIALYEKWITTQPALLASLPEPRGKDLVCWCAPDPCHGDVLLKLATTRPARP